jgi:hypothetical protein
VGTIVIEVPEEHKELAATIQELVKAVGSQVTRSGGGKAVDYAAVERSIGEKVGAVERAAHRTTLQALDVDRQRVRIEGKTYSQVGRCEATYYTMTGPVTVLRSLYRADGERNAPVVDAVSLRAGVVAEGWLPQTAQAMAHLLQQGTSREAEATARQMGRLPYSRSSFERVGHALGDEYVVRNAEIEDALIKDYEIPKEARSVSVALDRVSVPMEEPRKKPVGRPRKVAPVRPVARNFRMAYGGTVTLHDKKGDAVHTIRYGRMPQGDEVGLCEGMADDVLELLRKRPGLQVAELTDGAPELHDLLDAQLSDAEIGKPVHRLIDFWHLVEKLHAAALVIHGEKEAAVVVRRWKMRLLNSSKAAEQILDEILASGREHVRVGDGHPVHDAITYLRNHRTRMDYAAARRAGLPIGSGNVEATCKSLFAQRLKRAGARWKEETGEHVVQLRALALSDRWDQAMALTLRPLRKAVRAVG